MAVTGTEIGSVSILKGNLANLPTLADGVLAVTEDTKKLYVGTATGNARAAMATQEAFIAPTLLNGWVLPIDASIAPGYMKDDFGFVHIRGATRSGTITGGTIIFTLPVGYRPSGFVRQVVSNFNGTVTSAAFLYIDALGNVKIDSAGSNNILSLEFAPFKAEG